MARATIFEGNCESRKGLVYTSTFRLGVVSGGQGSLADSAVQVRVYRDSCFRHISLQLCSQACGHVNPSYISKVNFELCVEAIKYEEAKKDRNRRHGLHVPLCGRLPIRILYSCITLELIAQHALSMLRPPSLEIL